MHFDVFMGDCGVVNFRRARSLARSSWCGDRCYGSRHTPAWHVLTASCILPITFITNAQSTQRHVRVHHHTEQAADLQMLNQLRNTIRRPVSDANIVNKWQLLEETRRRHTLNSNYRPLYLYFHEISIYVF